MWRRALGSSCADNGSHLKKNPFSITLYVLQSHNSFFLPTTSLPASPCFRYCVYCLLITGEMALLHRHPRQPHFSTVSATGDVTQARAKGFLQHLPEFGKCRNRGWRGVCVWGCVCAFSVKLIVLFSWLVRLWFPRLSSEEPFFSINHLFLRQHNHLLKGFPSLGENKK